jgi:hypothetical protein
MPGFSLPLFVQIEVDIDSDHLVSLPCDAEPEPDASASAAGWPRKRAVCLVLIAAIAAQCAESKAAASSGGGPSRNRTDIAAFLIASFDIECVSRGGSFPDASKPDDAIIMVATTLQVQGEQQPRYRHIVCTKPCDPVPGAEVS